MTCRRLKKSHKVTLIRQGHVTNAYAAKNGFDAPLAKLYHSIFKKIHAGPPVYKIGSNEPTLSPQIRMVRQYL
jgi:hypothetical protein